MPWAQLYGGGYISALLQTSCTYYIACITLHWIAPRVLHVRNIQAQSRQPGQVTREAFNSLGPIAIKAWVLTIVECLHAKGWGRLYDGLPSDTGQVAYILATIVALDYLHDSWFYWTHRWLHSRLLYKHIHAIHHRSNVPTAFTGYSFHVVEAMIVFANEIIVCFLFPIHIGVHRVYHLFTTVIHNGRSSTSYIFYELPHSVTGRGHAGYEIAPFIPSLEAVIVALVRRVHPLRKDLSGALNTVQHHDMHHRYPTRHFSLYFTHWDRWCGTEHPAYCQQVEKNKRLKAALHGGSRGESQGQLQNDSLAAGLASCKDALLAQQ